ncbi:MAG: UDP-glucose-undecaprenyl-phosphate glucosyltransferase [Candidatus Magasanikbacteria bacterium GW2011_GWA2_45_39]|uniref:UDP-glucose-undecaprenyl-phosphate glucosyltransferase n=2 Tax=Candidatus Magasanikiibacteriota TaxID=1752731 RepID=A0A0G1PMU8_9BACT|nr:MAG: UDP-glucose-undecaprenyl-phosphate glucosyltransferase [Candidatus Magasanikbacteria bacterium GW2011_GWA2_45_39]HBW73913.1 hypothetical protein [Candidatus Magasanikbacteria bacterium]
MELSVIIPAYNESEVIARTVRHVDEFFAKEHIDGEMIVVDDGSTDGTGGVLAHVKNTTSPLKIISFSKNTGKGAACKAGFTASRGSWSVFMDADESTTIDTWNTFKPFTKQFDILIGSRSIAGARVLKRQNIVRILAGKLGNKWIKLITGLPFYDTQCGFKAFHERTKSLLAYTQVNGWAFDIEWLAVAQKTGFKIKELPVEWHNDTTSLVRPIDYPRVLWEVVNIKFHIKKIPPRA